MIIFDQCASVPCARTHLLRPDGTWWDGWDSSQKPLGSYLNPIPTMWGWLCPNQLLNRSIWPVTTLLTLVNSDIIKKRLLQYMIQLIFGFKKTKRWAKLYIPSTINSDYILFHIWSLFSVDVQKLFFFFAHENMKTKKSEK